MALDPRGADLKRYLAEHPGGPVVMLNLLRWAEGRGASYEQYGRALLGGLLERYGAALLYAGDGSTALVAEEGQAWDAVLLVRYPSREAFTRMVADPDYQAIAHLRTEALSEAVLQATTPGPAPDQSRTGAAVARAQGPVAIGHGPQSRMSQPR